MKRAFVPGGGGPNLGLLIGFLEVCAERGIEFDVVSSACIGAWVTVIYYSSEGDAEQRVKGTYKWFKPVFQPKSVHDKFPIPRVFAPDYRGNAKAHWEYATDLRNLREAFVPSEIFRVGLDTLKFMTQPYAEVHDTAAQVGERERGQFAGACVDGCTPVFPLDDWLSVQHRADWRRAHFLS
jgi:hypothetical protein